MKLRASRAIEKARAMRALARASRPRLPVMLDSLRLRRAPYDVAHLGTGLTFRLLPGCGDWFTYYECLVRNDYLTGAPALRSGDTVLDIGGNYGAFSLLASRLVGPDGAVHCYD